MAMTNVELYEALKGSIPDKAARLIAEAFPAAKDLATKAYVDEKIAQVLQAIADLRTEMHAESKTSLRWMLGLFIPVWAATMGTLIVALTKL
jgi:hypothetical protein